MEFTKAFFEPGSVTVVGATDRQGSVGRTVLENLLLGRDKRNIYPINPKRKKILDVDCYSSIGSLPETPDLVVIVTAAKLVPGIIKESCEAGIKSAVIISAGFKEAGDEGQAREEEILNTARKYNMRIIGPNCLGVLRPSANLNATFANKTAKP